VRWPAALFVVAALGCGSSTTPGSEDASFDVIDAAVNTVDADPNCSAWNLASVDIARASLMESLPVHPERSARIMVDALHCPGDTPAPPEVAPTLENEFLAITMSVWRATPACASPEVVQRPVTVKFPYAGRWRIVTSGDTLTVDVVAAPDVRCDAAGPCSLDCQCGTGEVCLTGVGLGGPFSECAVPCEFSRECGGTGSCDNITDGIPFLCRAGEECSDPSRPCPAGFDCNSGSCEPTFVLNGTTRRSCTCDSDCDAPLRCAWQFGATEGRCEAVCLTNNDNWCQGPHTCGRGSVEAGSVAVCAWVGD